MCSSTQLLNELNAPVSAEGVFNKTRVAVFRASNGAQMPSVSSSLLEDMYFSSLDDLDFDDGVHHADEVTTLRRHPCPLLADFVAKVAGDR